MTETTTESLTLTRAEEEFVGWQQHPVTRKLMQLLDFWKRQRQERWSSGEFTDLSQFGTAILNAKAIGNVELIDKIRTLDHVTFFDEVSDAEQFRP